MRNIDYTIERVRAYKRLSGLSTNAFAIQAGMRESAIRNMMAETWNPTAETLRKLESAIPPDFFQKSV